MNLRKVLNRIRGREESGLSLEQLARDVGFGAAEGQLEELLEISRETVKITPQEGYERGFLDALSIIITAYESGIKDREWENKGNFRRAPNPENQNK